MKKMEIDKELYRELTSMISTYLEDKHDLLLGQFEAEFFLDELLLIVAPSIYNKGLEDAITSVRAVSERLEEELDLRKIT